MKTKTYEVVSGTRTNPGQVIKTFTGDHKCGGPATACLRWFQKNEKKIGPAFFRRVHA